MYPLHFVQLVPLEHAPQSCPEGGTLMCPHRFGIPFGHMHLQLELLHTWALAHDTLIHNLLTSVRDYLVSFEAHTCVEVDVCRARATLAGGTTALQPSPTEF